MTCDYVDYPIYTHGLDLQAIESNVSRIIIKRKKKREEGRRREVEEKKEREEERKPKYSKSCCSLNCFMNGMEPISYTVSQKIKKKEEDKKKERLTK